MFVIVSLPTWSKDCKGCCCCLKRGLGCKDPRDSQRVGCEHATLQRAAFARLCRLQLRAGSRGAGVSRVTATSLHELGWVEIVANQTVPTLDTLGVMKSTRLKVLIELQSLER